MREELAANWKSDNRRPRSGDVSRAKSMEEPGPWPLEWCRSFLPEGGASIAGER